MPILPPRCFFLSFVVTVLNHTDVSVCEDVHMRYLSVCESAHMSAGAYRDHGCQMPLKLELQVLISDLL